MADNRTLLGHLALKLGTHPENIAVEALGHILSTSEAALRAIEDVMKTGGADVGRMSPDVRTQASDKEGARPDLAGRDEDGVERVLIEAKFWAGLTERQPVTYLERLPKDKPSVLLFVTPRARFESLWAELHTRVTDEAMDWRHDRDSNANLWTAQVRGEHRLMLTSWKALLDSMTSRASIAGDSRAEADIRQLLGLTQRMDEEAFLPLRQDELGPEFPQRVLSLQRLTKDIFERARESEWVDTSGLRGNPPWRWYMRLAGAGATIGIYFDLWAQSRGTPLWLILDRWGGDRTLKVSFEDVRRRLAPLYQEDPPGIIDRGTNLLVPINLPLGVEYDRVLGAVVERLEEIARLIDSADTTS